MKETNTLREYILIDSKNTDEKTATLTVKVPLLKKSENEDKFNISYNDDAFCFIYKDYEIEEMIDNECMSQIEENDSVNSDLVQERVLEKIAERIFTYQRLIQTPFENRAMLKNKYSVKFEIFISLLNYVDNLTESLFSQLNSSILSHFVESNYNEQY